MHGCAEIKGDKGYTVFLQVNFIVTCINIQQQMYVMCVTTHIVVNIYINIYHIIIYITTTM